MSFRFQSRLSAKLCSFLLLVMLCLSAKAGMVPRNNAVLNYRQVMFEYDPVIGATQYKIIITQTNASKPVPPIVITNRSLAVLVTDGLVFGGTYSWKVEAWKQQTKLATSPEMQFSIEWAMKVDTAFVKFDVRTDKLQRFHNDLLFIDHLGILINRKGEPVWYYPDERLESSNDQFNFRALQMTSAGTLTFIYNARALEADIDGLPLWIAPENTQLSGAQVETYHHDLQKLPDGTYLTCGYHFENEPHLYNAAKQCHVRYNTLLQFDARGNLVWFWNEKDHVDKSVIFRNYTTEETEISGTHLNGFAVNRTDSSIVMSFRNTSELLKIDMKQYGKLVYTWSGSLSQKINNNGIGFINQHGPTITPEGNILIYNNNISPTRDAAQAVYPKLLVVSNPTAKKPSVKMWEYECVWKEKPDGVQGKEGYARVLPNKNILVNTGGAERMLEVTPDKKLVWECIYKKYDAANTRWMPFNNYRCSYTSSLFPCYFTVERIYRDAKTPLPEFRINNEGSENDTYVAQIMDEPGNILFTKKVSLKSRSAMNVKYTVGTQKSGLRLWVWPEGRQQLARIIDL